jgi:hypothetical protein
LVAANAILVQYYWQTANTRTLNESIDGLTGRPAANPPIAGELGVYHRTVPELMFRVYWPSEPPIWQQFILDSDLNPKWWLLGVALSTVIIILDLVLDVYISTICKTPICRNIQVGQWHTS